MKLEEKWSVHCAEAAVLAQASAASCLAIELLSCQALPGQPLILPTKHVLLQIFVSAEPRLSIAMHTHGVRPQGASGLPNGVSVV